ncbi:restriction endonuclease subunit S [Gillisia sp. Hel_I_29]|uniref:restriction endonuclease subunit S n=1 Tax=Gillisia sp. Hel_I_29 TaxID=1249975 RepID=UPI0005501B37|nr:restriction endonuclease subunit S [Gillisia sp. Hel_I_29]
MNKYTSYKDSGVEWIGVIPKHWKVSKLNYIFKFNTGFTPSTSNNEFYSNGLHDWINISDLGSKYINESKTKLTDLAVAGKEIVPKGSLMYSFKLSVGKMGFTSKDVYTNEAIFSVLPHPSLNLNYYYYLLGTILKFNSNENIYGAKILNQQLIKNSKLTIPPSDEQIAIANYLDKKTTEIDTLISKKELLIELLEEEKTAVVNQAVTKGIDQNVPMKDSGVEWLGEIPEHWKIKKLKFLGKVQNGVSEGGEYFGSGYPFVTYGDVYYNATLPNIPSGLAKSDDEAKIKYSVKEGDVFFTRTSETIEEIGIASTCLNTIEGAIFAGFLIQFRPENNLINKHFSKFYFRSFIPKTFFVKEMNLVTRASLSQGLLKRLPVLLPPYKEQKKIGKFLDIELTRRNMTISKMGKEIEFLKEYKTALISEVVTGKVDVRKEILVN